MLVYKFFSLSLFLCHPSSFMYNDYRGNKTGETVHNPKEDGENLGRKHPKEQKEYKLDPETEWCDRHYQEHKRKQTQMLPEGHTSNTSC